MADCKACGAWFSSTAKTEICPTCERALRRLNGYAVPVVHGQWIYEEEPDKDGNVPARCSVCFAGDLHSTAMMNKVPHCWKCGAKMDGGSNA